MDFDQYDTPNLDVALFKAVTKAICRHEPARHRRRPIGDHILIHEYLAARYVNHEWRTTDNGDWQHRPRGEHRNIWQTLTFANAQMA